MEFMAVESREQRGCGQVVWASFFFFSSRRRHTRWTGDWSSDVCSSDLEKAFLTPVSRDLLDARDRAADALAAAGAVVDRRPMPELRRALELFLTVLANEVGVTTADILLEIGRASGRERGEISGGAGLVK